MTTALANALAYEEERKRAAALAEIDRAKNAFFSNVSHEFRTPLTLMLGPLEDALARQASFAPADRETLSVVHRNALRLLRLVNTLLDFSRIEAGRMQAVFAPVDLASLTADLASTFRSAVERVGMFLEIDCPPLPAPVHVDRDLWEKIVLNLLSNAFKFTLDGGITVRLAAVDHRPGVRSGPQPVLRRSAPAGNCPGIGHRAEAALPGRTGGRHECNRNRTTARLDRRHPQGWHDHPAHRA